MTNKTVYEKAAAEVVLFDNTDMVSTAVLVVLMLTKTTMDAIMV